jgi:BASS family bile acid:Na+ symporter
MIIIDHFRGITLGRIINKFNRLFVLWVIMAGILAFLNPGIFIAQRAFMEIYFAITMFGIGMVINLHEFITIFKNYKVILIGVMAQFSIMPISAFFVAKAFSFSDEFSLGLILTGSAPGAMASNVLSYLAGADVAYSVSLTTVSTFLAPVLTPLLTLFLANTILDIPFWDLMKSVSMMVLLPLILGVFGRKISGGKIETIIKIFPAISSIFIAFICGLVIALNRDYILNMTLWIFVAALLLNLSGLFLGYMTGRIFGFDRLKKRALSIEIGMQNAGLGSVLALKHFNEKTAIPAIIFVFICIMTASILVPIWSQRPDAKNA